MLAHNGLALITEKLQNQKLEEPAQTSCSKLPVTQDNPTKTASQQQSNNLSVKGKNVWAQSLESERQGRHKFGAPDVKTVLRPPEKATSSICLHKKQSCQCCDSAPGTPTAPPKKKHCRSLSVPPDGPMVLPAPSKDTGSKIWKPIAVTPRSISNFQTKDRHNLSAQCIESSKWLPKLSSGFKLVPVVPSPPSVDSGHYTTSDLQTPPGSPVPRPASAASDTSFSSLGSAWLDYSPMRTRIRVLENRSLSCEDRISASSSTMSMPCVHGSIDPSSSCCSSQDGSNSCSSGIPRCHSQPCVLHHRRCGKKRRRDCDRPTLNFNKMTETAYSHSHRRSEPWNTPISDQKLHLSGQDGYLDNMTSHTLNTIASSPLDSELPVMTKHLDLIHAASVALPLTPPDHSSPSFSLLMAREQEEEEEEEEENEADNCNCHDSRTDDRVGLFPISDLDLEQIENH
ncbi:protein FAM53A-like isoform X2 [Physella acuta]|uniref:protein FAM53A-like isoform X2 n=1 Tax=Physella acuta TaxID=109671 RepID=UPI0027DCAE2D|nr:protein FAM53A-like isoform X2 [Physella acuta]